MGMQSEFAFMLRRNKLYSVFVNANFTQESRTPYGSFIFNFSMNFSTVQLVC